MAINRAFAFFLAVLAAISAPAACLGADPVRVAAAKSTSPAASFAARQSLVDGFKVLPEKCELFTGDMTIALPDAAMESKNGKVALKSLADYDGRSPLPSLETAFTLNEAKDVDLDVTLDRGRIDLTSQAASGKATVRVRFWDQSWKIVLDGPGSRVAMELCGRWPAGSRFKVANKGEKGAEPVASLVLLVVKGSTEVDLGGFAVGMRAPPGPALVEWDSLAGTRPQPLKLEKPPLWADPEAALSERGKKVASLIEKFRKARAENPAAALKAFLESTDPIEQHIALVTLGAIDDLNLLGQVLTKAKSAELWDFGITIIRHWLGRCPGNDQKLYASLISPTQGYSPTQARTILQLLIGFSPDDLKQPETYEVLIEYLRHDQAAIRNLAEWHLVRLAPKGKGIAFKPNGTKDEYEAAYRAWKKLIPSGSLPPAPKKE